MNSLESRSVLSDCQAIGKRLSLFNRLFILLLAILCFFAPGTTMYFIIKHLKDNARKNPRTVEAFQFMWEVIDKQHLID